MQLKIDNFLQIIFLLRKILKNAVRVNNFYVCVLERNHFLTFSTYARYNAINHTRIDEHQKVFATE